MEHKWQLCAINVEVAAPGAGLAQGTGYAADECEGKEDKFIHFLRAMCLVEQALHLVQGAREAENHYVVAGADLRIAGYEHAFAIAD